MSGASHAQTCHNIVRNAIEKNHIVVLEGVHGLLLFSPNNRTTKTPGNFLCRSGRKKDLSSTSLTIKPETFHLITYSFDENVFVKYGRIFDWIDGYSIFELGEPFQFEEEPRHFPGPIRYKDKAFKGVLSERKVAITPEERHKLVYDRLLKHLTDGAHRDANGNELPEDQLRAFRGIVQTLALPVATSKEVYEIDETRAKGIKFVEVRTILDDGIEYFRFSVDGDIDHYNPDLDRGGYFEDDQGRMVDPDSILERALDLFYYCVLYQSERKERRDKKAWFNILTVERMHAKRTSTLTFAAPKDTVDPPAAKKARLE